MKLKRRITKEEFDALPDNFKESYIENGSDFALDLDGDEDTGALKRALDRLRVENKENKDLVSKLTKQIEELDNNDARKRGDIATLERSWKEKLDVQKKESDDKISVYQKIAKSNIVDSAVSSIANKFKTPSLIAQALKSRLDVDFADEKASIRVLDKEGNVSALSISDLEKEFLENKEYSSIIIGSKAAGSASSVPSSTTGGSATSEKVDLTKLSPVELANYVKAKKEAQANN